MDFPRLITPAETVQNTAIFSVTQLNQRARQLLEISFANIRVEGEISGLSRPSSGHWYFTLKDEQSQVRCAMFRSRTAMLRFLPKDGDRVELRAKVSLYENRGDYQLIVDDMKPAGEGALLLAFQQLKDRLAMAGLFAEEHKKPLPKARRIGVITSPTGAAIHDILTVLKRRSPSIEVDLYPTLVQGRDAAPQIVAAIERANRDQRVDVLIVGRGGGSLEDLWCFNDERVAWAIFHSRIPVVSAVGHEVDFSIADFVADARAPTPSAAAELLSPDQQRQSQLLEQMRLRLIQANIRSFRQRQLTLANLQQRLQGPQRRIEQISQNLDGLEGRLRRAFEHSQLKRQRLLDRLSQTLSHQHPERRIAEQSKWLAAVQQQLTRAMQKRMEQRHYQLAAQAKLLDSLSPLNVLGRGYAIARTPDGKVVHDSSEVQQGDAVHILLRKGRLETQVTDIHAATDD
ncbi:exodeoxyribonuclease VII large subunit [Thalassolituus sp. LLYu03]|uniref:exodeoxyribonuclease VII large subunit n=1 Tax=Thalassolituus sp. LLYu03 TaxID=3421656 RepID=UPI003D2DC562